MRISDWSSDVCSSDLQTFVVQSRDPRLQGGIEFGQYAQLVSANLVREGYRTATNPAQADLVVNMGYHVDTGREKVVNDLLGGPTRYGWGRPWYRRPYFQDRYSDVTGKRGAVRVTHGGRRYQKQTTHN